MPLISWRSKHSVGVKALDDDHLAMMKILNELHAAALLEGRSRSLLRFWINFARSTASTLPRRKN